MMIDKMDEYIDNWFKTKKYDDFYFNLGNDLHDYMIK